MRRLQPYIVNLNENKITGLENDGLAVPITTGLWEWRGAYDDATGLKEDHGNPQGLIY